MELIEIPRLPVLRGEEAAKALRGFINEVKEQKGKELTEKQTDALIKFAKGLIASIEEKHSTTPHRENEEKRFVKHLKNALTRHVPEFMRPHNHGDIWRI